MATKSMAEPSTLDPSNHPAFLFDPALFPCDSLPPPPPDLFLGDDFDLDLDFDFDFSVDDFLRSADNPASSPDLCPGNGSGVSSSSFSSPRLRSSDLSHNSRSSHPASPDSAHCSGASDVVDNDAKVEVEKGLKRKKDRAEGCSNVSLNKIHRLEVGGNVVDDKRKARLMRNRESAHQSRQRKKQYVEELEEKVKSMHSTINQLNARISCVMAENASLRQQLVGSSTSPAVYPPLGPVPPVHFPWIPGFALRPQGSQAPLVPIPRLKPQKPAPVPRTKKLASKTKKVASVSLLGLLLIMLVIGVAPGVNMWFRGTGFDIDDTGTRMLNGSRGRVLSVTGHGNGLIGTNETGLYGGNTSLEKDGDFRVGTRCEDRKIGFTFPSIGSDVLSQNSSEALPALLYVPRNGKHVKIDGNLIIHSVLAGEKAMSQAKEKQSSSEESKGTALAVAGNMISALAVPKGKIEVDNTYGNNMKSISDGSLPQWLREGMAGPTLSSGLCTEVFQFDVTPSSTGIIPTTANATSIVNASDNLPYPSAHQRMIKSRRILYNGHNAAAMNNNSQQFGKPLESKNVGHSKPVSSVVVSVLADPKEAGNGDVDGMISPKSISRIFVVVLLDSVKYVTYSCVLPFKTTAPVL